MATLILKNLFYILLKPGLVICLLPYLILKYTNSKSPEFNLNTQFILSGMLFITGLSILLYCVVNFIKDGHGTLSPIDPTKKLVIKGLYKYSRNPMYLGVITMLISLNIFFQSYPLAAYTLLICTIFHLFITYFEEPRLVKDFEKEYVEYCKRVNRWI